MDRQIEKLAEELLFYTIIPNDDLCDEVAEYIINAGYRKQEDVAREIFAEIEREIEDSLESLYRFKENYVKEEDIPTVQRLRGKIDSLRVIYCFIKRIKKKYGLRGWEL